VNNPVVGTDSVDRAIPNDVRFDGNVTFGLGGTASYVGGNIDLNNANRTVTLGNTTYFYGNISNGGLVVDGGAGSGTRNLYLYGNNTYAGGTVVRTNVNFGLGSDNAIGSGALIFTNNAGSLLSSTSSLRAVPMTTVTPQVRTLTNDVVIDAGMNVILDSISSVVVASNTNTVLIDLNLAGNISGGGGLIKSNNNTVTLSGNNSYTGPTTVVNGTLAVITNNISASITSNTIVVTFSNTPADGTYAILPGALTGSYAATYSNLSPTKQATFSSASPASVTVSTVKQNQTINFGSLTAKTYGDSSFDLTAVASSGLAVSYTSSDPTVASISGNTVMVIKPGTTIITASQAGDGVYNAAPSVGQILTVNKASQTITGLAPADTKTVGASSYILVVSQGASSSPLTFSSANTSVATVSSAGLVTIVGAGSTTLRVNQAGDANYLAATEVTQILTVNSAGSTPDDAYPGKGLSEVAPNGLTYLANYAFGGSSSNAPKLPVQDVSDPAKLSLIVYVRTNDSGTGGVLSVKGQTNSGLSGWSTNTFGPSSIPADQSDAPAGTQKQIFSVDASGDRQFLRLKVTK
ncbi:MAG: hypothetical protein EBT57_08745, partial [Verrucomicrobia bacterium]|nr:hypothetical protein [Verrucomicrobiota bacterium]